MGRFAVRILSIVLATVIVVVGGGVFWAWHSYRADGPLTSETTVIIPRGSGVQEIALLLRKSGVIDNPHLFELGARYTEMARRMRAGEFAFAPGISMQAAVEHLVSGELVKRRLTIPEGLLTEQIHALVRDADGLTGDVPLSRPDGIYLPETYFFLYGATRNSILSRMRKSMEEEIARAWAERDENSPLSSPEEAVILASIIEKETGVDAERARVSAVFHNRLKRRMRLQSDPTVAYAVTGGGRPLGRPLTRADLNIDSDYNTYRRVGLPPGPIANPGRAALLAAVKPADTEELYFVADGTGGHVFAKTLREHNRNVAKWRRLQRRQAQ